jgi:hypothetical protein
MQSLDRPVPAPPGHPPRRPRGEARPGPAEPTHLRQHVHRSTSPGSGRPTRCAPGPVQARSAMTEWCPDHRGYAQYDVVYPDFHEACDQTVNSSVRTVPDRRGGCRRPRLTIAVTVVAGPRNYVGVNPRVNCQLPESSQPPPAPTASVYPSAGLWPSCPHGLRRFHRPLAWHRSPGLARAWQQPAPTRQRLRDGPIDSPAGGAASLRTRLSHRGETVARHSYHLRP